MPLVDALRAIASQLIVLHHLAFYGPMSDAVMELAPALLGWLAEHGRVAVQAFLACGGFMAARTLAPDGLPRDGSPLPLLWRRYLRLAPPLLAALAIAIVLSALARALNPHESIPQAPGLGQLLAHALLLQDVLGIEALSAGVWYVAIDFQLFALTLGLLWLARAAGGGGAAHAGDGAARALARTKRLSIGLVAGLGLASLFVFNRNPSLDAWAPYFFGAYALGACSWWAGDRRVSSGWLAAIAAAGLTALALDYRVRIAVALAVALALGLARRDGLLERWPRSAVLSWLGGISYSVFLVHFPICVAIGALVWRLAPGQPLASAAGILAAWAASVAGGALFHRQVERRFTGSGRGSSGSAGPAPADP
ncbi:MAG TPA: acyltransferase family protein [Quisquiliibacterium sp.]|nr:acyltransferase family protein [Quisquiliibacterium sp.]